MLSNLAWFHRKWLSSLGCQFFLLAILAVFWMKRGVVLFLEFSYYQALLLVPMRTRNSGLKKATRREGRGFHDVRWFDVSFLVKILRGWLGDGANLYPSYCWWLKSCTTWDVWNPINNGKNYLSTGAGFQPSTVWTNLKQFACQIPQCHPGDNTCSFPATMSNEPPRCSWKRFEWDSTILIDSQ